MLKESLSEEYLLTIKNRIIQIKPYLKEFITLWENLNDSIAPYPAKKSGYFLNYQGKKLCSSIDPVQEAKRIFEHYKTSNKILFLLGAGNPYLIPNLLLIRNNNQITILIENNLELLAFYWKTNPDFHQYLLTPNCHFFCSKNLFYLWNYLNSLKIEKLQGHIIFKHLPSIQREKEFYQIIEEKIHILFKSNFSSLLTKFEFETLWFNNIITNSSFLSKTNYINRLNYYKDFFSGIPFVIIGAGPSLKYSFDILKILQKKAFLFSTDTALKPLLKMGIQPDAVHILDAQIHTYFHLRGVNVKNIVIFADLVIHPFILKTIHPLGWIFSSTIRYHINHEGKIQIEKTKGIVLLEQILGEIQGIQSGGSVSTSAFEIARYLGAKHIFLIGMDLCWTNRQLHCVDTHHYEKWYTIINRINTLENINENIFQKRIKVPVKGIRKALNYGDHVLNLYKSWFEETALELKEINPEYKIYNLTYDGSYIENMDSISIKEIQELPDLDKKRIYEFKNRIKNQHYILQQHKEILKLIKHINTLVYDFKNTDHLEKKELFYNKFKNLCNQYIDLDVFIHRVDTYIERNKEKLTEERIIHLRYENLMKELKRFLKHYISFNTSLIHSDVF
ncbi:MAG: hypothetical protein KatS3mg129_0336 [Leptospiraceae bacterium]|nr:MAG: hypothetical protein KatS3mg129_0336 [Leptospiraceae bacterium]